MSVGKRRASSLNSFRAASIPRVDPRSLSAARASKNPWSTVVFSAAMNLWWASGKLTFRCAVNERGSVLRLVSPERRDELLVRVCSIERDQVRKRLHPRRNFNETSDVLLNVNLSNTFSTLHFVCPASIHPP